MSRDLLRSCFFLCVVVCGLHAHAIEVHRYTFNDGTADDSIGSADGTLTGTASIGGLGTLNLTGGGAGNSYLDLPDGIASSASSGGTSGQITAEAWVNINANTNWSVIFSFGNSGPDAEDNNGDDGDYWQLIPQNGANGVLRTTTHAASGAEVFVDDGVNNSALAAGALQHVVNVLDAGADTNELYVNGVLVGATTLQPGFDPNTFGTVGDTQNWLGRSQWGDPSLDGSYDEFRIYDHALTQSEVTTSFNDGPVPPPAIPLTPTLTINRDDGSMMLQGGQTASQIVGYTMQSPFGALDPSSWSSIAGNLDAPPSGDGSFDNDDEWTILSATGSHTDLSEFEFDGGDGGELGIGAFLNLGGNGTWIQSPTEDVTMDIKLDDGSTIATTILYTGNKLQRSDLNFDGSVDGQDWPLFRDNAQSDMSALSLAEAYARGDLDGDQDNDYSDFLLFQTDFDAANGAGAFAALISTTVPEPSSAVLLVGLVAGCWAAQPRPRRLAATRQC